MERPKTIPDKDGIIVDDYVAKTGRVMGKLLLTQQKNPYQPVPSTTLMQPGLVAKHQPRLTYID